MLLRPITTLRVWSVVVTVVLLAVLFLPSGSIPANFLIGLCAGLSLAVHAVVWNKQLRWDDDGSRDGFTGIDLREPRS